MGVTVCGHDLKDTVVDGQDGDVKGAAAKIKDQDVLLALTLVQAISNGGSSPAGERQETSDYGG